MNPKPLWSGIKSRDEFYRKIALEYYETGTTIQKLSEKYGRSYGVTSEYIEQGRFGILKQLCIFIRGKVDVPTYWGGFTKSEMKAFSEHSGIDTMILETIMKKMHVPLN